MSFFEDIGSRIKKGFENISDALEDEKHSHTHLGITFPISLTFQYSIL